MKLLPALLLLSSTLKLTIVTFFYLICLQLKPIVFNLSSTLLLVLSSKLFDDSKTQVLNSLARIVIKRPLKSAFKTSLVTHPSSYEFLTRTYAICAVSRFLHRLYGSRLSCGHSNYLSLVLTSCRPIRKYTMSSACSYRNDGSLSTLLGCRRSHTSQKRTA